jgi:2-polyprenyl-3-methyl-5-hydroxy-6-metoxy-1,4-benzoquinol methylase
VRYRVNGREIRSENAAKPYSQQSAVVADYLKQQARVGAVLDYGCGKLRYSNLLATIGRRVTFVDSKIQLTRLQRVRGRRTTVTEFVARTYRHAHVVPAEELRAGRARYDLVTCINVLSAIASRQALYGALDAIRRSTRRNGVAVFINQHSNSSFKRYARGERHLFGHIHQRRGKSFYYGLLSETRVVRLLTKRGFKIRRAWGAGEINFVEASPGKKS